MSAPHSLADASNPSPRAIAVADDLCREAIIEAAGLAESYARSAAEAAWRGDVATLGVHLRQLRLAVIEALQVFRGLAKAGGD
jgi:hypothetical protein